MEIKSKFSSGKIPWSLVAKAGGLGAVWFLLPYPFFFVAALYLYVVPPFQSLVFLAPFLASLLLGFVMGGGFVSALTIAVLLFLILGLKELAFINRRAAYETLLFLLLFFLFVSFYGSVSNWASVMPFLTGIGVGALVFILLRGFFEYVGIGERKERDIVLAVGSFFLWEISWALFFLPFTFVSRAALLFFVSVCVAELAADYLLRTVSLQRVRRFLFALGLVVLFLSFTTAWRP